ncbi:MAG TPA: P-II family nitrogen regulator [Thiobacillus sp.]
MKQIVAIVRPHRLEQIEHALHGLEHLPGFTLFPSRGHSRGQGPHHAFAPTEWNPDTHDRLTLMVFCPDELAPKVVEAIRAAAYTGHSGDGLIAVSELADVLRIRSGERGDAAL